MESQVTWQWGRINQPFAVVPAVGWLWFCFISHFKWRLATASLWFRDPARGTSQLYLRVAWTSAFKQFWQFISDWKFISCITISIHQPHRFRRTSHDLVLIFPIWSCMSCNKLLQSQPLRHFHYLNGISPARIWLLYVLYLVVCMSWYLVGCMSCILLA